MLEGGSSPEKPRIVADMTILGQSFNRKSDLRILLTEELRAKVEDWARQRSQVNVCLKIVGHDKKNKKYALSTSEWTTLLKYW